MHTGGVIRMFSAKSYETGPFEAANERHSFTIAPVETRLNADTAGLAAGADAVSIFVNDDASRPVLEVLRDLGVTCVALRCAGFNNVDLAAAKEMGLTVVRVPAYSPNAVAEHTLALILAVNRSIHRSYTRVRDGNFSLEGLVGFDLAGRTVGVVGTGRIGAIVARLLWHLRCEVLAVDPFRDQHLLDLGVEYTTMEDLFVRSQIVTLSCPLTEDTHHLVDRESIGRMRDGVMLVNTGRGALVDTSAVIEGLKSGRIGSLALDVYEEEADLFFVDRSEEVIADDTFARLLTFPNVLITAHQAFLTDEALVAIAETTLDNVAAVLRGAVCENEVQPV